MKINQLAKFGGLLAMALVLTSCANSAAKEMAIGQQEYGAQRYDLSYVHVLNAAQKGDPDAMYALGYMYYYGKGVNPDQQKAEYWISRAAAAGQPLAIKAQNMMQTTPDSSKQSVTTSAPTVVKHKFITSRPTQTASLRGLTRDERFLMQQSSANYTIQMVGSINKNDVVAFKHRFDLGSQAHIYRTSHNGNSWFVMVYGSYPSASLAVRALHSMPHSFKHEHPWVKSIARVKQEIQTN